MPQRQLANWLSMVTTFQYGFEHGGCEEVDGMQPLSMWCKWPAWWYDAGTMAEKDWYTSHTFMFIPPGNSTSSVDFAIWFENFWTKGSPLSFPASWISINFRYCHYTFSIISQIGYQCGSRHFLVKVPVINKVMHYLRVMSQSK